jgi:hypothetical protein
LWIGGEEDNMTYEVFNIQDLYFNQIIGDVTLGLIVGCIILTIMSMKFKIPFQVIIGICALWSLIVYTAYLQLTLLYMLIILAASGLFYFAIAERIGK